jgi:hypothetical protein
MHAEPTGILSFTWLSPEVKHDSFFVDVYLNDGFIKRETVISTQGENTFSINQLAEGTQARLFITPVYKNSKYFNQVIEPDPQSVPIHYYEQGIGLDGLVVNGDRVNLTHISGRFYSGEINVLNSGNFFHLNLLSPRDSQPINVLDDPLFNKVVFKTLSKKPQVVFEDSATTYVEEVQSNGEVFSDNIACDIPLDANSQIVFDIYDSFGEVTTVSVDGKYDPVKIKDARFHRLEENAISNTYIYECNTTNSDYRLQYYDINIYSDIGRSNLISTHRSNNATYGQFVVDNTITTYASLVPYSNNITGHTFEGPTFFPKPEPIVRPNQISGLSVISDSFSSEFNCSYVLRGNAKSTINLKIYSEPNQNSDLYITTTIPSGGSFTYEALNNFTGKNDFYYFVDLINDDSGEIEDSRTGMFLVDSPTINANIGFNYMSGITSYEASTQSSHALIELLFSGLNYSEYAAYTGVITTDELEPSGTFIARHISNLNVFDTHSIHAKALRPQVHLNPDGWQTASASNYNFSIHKSNYPTYCNLYVKDSARYESGVLPTGYADIFSFDDFLSYEPYQVITDLSLGAQYLDIEYNSISNKSYSITGYDATGNYQTGFFSSGNFKIFKTLAFDGYGQGQASSELLIPAFIEPAHELLYNHVIHLEDLAITSDSFSRHSIPSGVDKLTINYSNYNFTSSPFIFHSLISPGINYPLLATQIAGLPEATGVTIMLSDDVSTTGYYIDFLVQPRN